MPVFFEGVLLTADQIADALQPIKSGKPFETQEVINRLIGQGWTDANSARAAKGLLLREDRAKRLALDAKGWSAKARRNFDLPSRLGFLIGIENDIVDSGASAKLDAKLARAFLPTIKGGHHQYTTEGTTAEIEALVKAIFPHWFATPHTLDGLHWVELEGLIDALPHRFTRKGPAKSTFEYRSEPNWLAPTLELAYAYALVAAAISHERYDLLKRKQDFISGDQFPVAKFLRVKPAGHLSAVTLPPATSWIPSVVPPKRHEVSSRASDESGRTSWNSGKKIGAKHALKAIEVRSIRAHLDREGRVRDLALFDLAIDSKLRGCDLIRIKIGALMAGSEIRHESMIAQQQAGTHRQFEISSSTRGSLHAWLIRRGGNLDDFAFPSRVNPAGHLSNRQFARLVDEWVGAIGLAPENYGTQSLRREALPLAYDGSASLPAPAKAIDLIVDQRRKSEHGALVPVESNYSFASALPFDGGRRFITFEGGEGTGKSTQARALSEVLSLGSMSAVLTREPGGTDLAEAVRNRILDKHYAAMGTAAEALAFSFARLEHMTTKILPALARGDWVVCDRFYDSTRAYQGAAGNVDPAFLDLLDSAATAGRTPDLTIILDLPAEISLARAAARRGDAAPDRFEGEALEFHQRLRAGFLEIAAKNPGRCHVINCEGLDPLAVQQQVIQAVKSRLMSHVAGKVLS